MKRWYQFYYEQVTILQQPAEELGAAQSNDPIIAIRQQPADQLEMPEITV